MMARSDRIAGWIRTSKLDPGCLALSCRDADQRASVSGSPGDVNRCLVPGYKTLRVDNGIGNSCYGFDMIHNTCHETICLPG